MIDGKRFVEMRVTAGARFGRHAGRKTNEGACRLLASLGKFCSVEALNGSCCYPSTGSFSLDFTLRARIQMPDTVLRRGEK